MICNTIKGYNGINAWVFIYSLNHLKTMLQNQRIYQVLQMDYTMPEVEMVVLCLLKPTICQELVD